jgi:cyanophycin synthetase
VAKVIGLDICGIDIMAESLSVPLLETGGAVIEVNAAPGFRMHLAPTMGQPRNVAAPVVDMLYPPGKPSRIPIIGVTGTNGKTTTTRLLANIAQNSGFKTGYTTTDGIYINGQLHQKGDTTGPTSAQYILRDPSVEFAVLETARGGLLRSGMGYDQCDIAVITNIKEDHLGLNDIHTLEDLAEVKGVVARSVKEDGWAILNAEDEQCLKIAEDLDCNVAFFSLNEENEHIIKLCNEGKTVAVFENGYITLKKGHKKIRIIDVADVPLTMGGKVKFMIANALAATLAAHLWGFTTRQITQSLQSFVPGYEQTPGRMNMFEFRRFNVMVDYAHNPHGYAAVEDYLKHVSVKRKVGIISGIGDRRDEDIKECAFIAGRMFDHVIIRQDNDLRGRTAEDINQLLLEGLNCCEKQVTHEYVAEETEAIRHAIEVAEDGDFIVALTDQITPVVNVIKEHLAREDKEQSMLYQSA